MKNIYKSNITGSDARQSDNKIHRPTYHRIGNYVIFEGGWSTIWDLGEDGLMMSTGYASVDSQLDVIWLSSWKVHGGPPEGITTVQDFNEALSRMPVLNKTRWACNCCDFGDAILIDCKTGQVDHESPVAKAAIKRIREYMKSVENSGRKAL